MNSTTMRVLGWAVPLLCMGGASYATYSQYQRLQTASRTRTTKQAEYTAALQNLDLARQKVQAEGRFAAVPRIDAEETQFLFDLKQRATKAGVEIVSWKTSTTKASETSADKSDANKKLLDGVDKVTSDLVLEGAYMAVRSFVEDLNQSRRLYTINNATWARGEKTGTQLTITVSRYVTATPTTTTRTEAKT